MRLIREIFHSNSSHAPRFETKFDSNSSIKLFLLMLSFFLFEDYGSVGNTYKMNFVFYSRHRLEET